MMMKFALSLAICLCAAAPPAVADAVKHAFGARKAPAVHSSEHVAIVATSDARSVRGLTDADLDAFARRRSDGSTVGDVGAGAGEDALAVALDNI